MAGSIVMVHGMWAAPWVWEPFKGYFEEKGFACHTPVLRHHEVCPSNPPPQGLGTTSLLDYANDLESYIRKLPDKPILMGHSMGGLWVQMLTQRDVAH